MSHVSFFANAFGFYDELPETHPFPDAEAAWFWCVKTSEAIHSGAQMRGGLSQTPRPCEAVDIQKVVLRLARQKILTAPQIDVLVEFGPRQLRPSKKIPAQLWQQAMDRLTPVLQHKGIIA